MFQSTALLNDDHLFSSHVDLPSDDLVEIRAGIDTGGANNSSLELSN